MLSNQKRVYLEVISSNPSDSHTIESYSGDRIELVSALQIGGVTPCGTIIRKSLQAASIPTHVIVRHHNNGFVHTKQEIELLLEDVKELKDRYHVHGIVIGGLEVHGADLLVDTLLVEEVVKECGGKVKVTFHKASDLTNNLESAVKTLAEMGVNQVLTQGGKQSALSACNIQAIRQIEPNLRKQKILAGGGINHSNVKSIIKQWEINRVHIGTCVRKNKYGAVDGQSLMEFRQILENLQ